MPVDTGLAQLSTDLLALAIVIFTLAMVAFAVEYAFGARGYVAATATATAAEAPERAAAPARVLEGAGGPAVSSAEVPDREHAVVPPTGSDRSWVPYFGRGAVAATAVGWALMIAVLITRGMSVDRVPWGNMYEFALAASLIAVTAFLVLLVRFPIRYLGGFVMFPVVLLLGLADTVLYTKAGPLVPALNSYWIKIHVSAAVTATGIFMVGFAMALLYLVRERYETAIASGQPPRRFASWGQRLPPAESLERMSFRTVAFAFPIWTFAIIAGAIWAEAAWGRYWGWDPKETWSFIAWVIYAAYLHARATAGWRGRKATMIAVVGFAAMMFNLFAVNTVVSGLHSYAGL